MKKIFTLCTILFAALILASCSSSFITKRRYTKGYYVERHQGRHTTPNQTAAHVPQTMPAASSKAADSKPHIEQGLANAPQPANNNRSTAPAPAKIKPSPAVKKAPLKHEAADAGSQLSLKESARPAHGQLEAAKAYADSGDALSLFWIVILVIIILWLLGVISGGWGLGILINLLLVIALILLILWLLRIL